jgi:hypothetical protein
LGWQLLVGDNYGARDSLAGIPHNNPRATMEKLEQRFGRYPEDDNRPIIIDNVIHTHIEGTDFISIRTYIDRIKTEINKRSRKRISGMT